MAVTVLKRPTGYIRSGSFSTIASGNVASVFGSLNIASVGHGFATGDIIYIQSAIENYNGFQQVFKDDANNFRVKDLEGTFVSFLKSTEISLYSTTSVLGVDNSHGWSCVHLPIIYKLSSSLWPTNSADTTRTISTVTDSDGYCAITASGDIKATGSAAALEFVKITGATDDDLNGVWQITAYTNDTTFTLEIPYSSANDTALTGASIQYYYNNYHVKVQVWGGLNNGHTYYAQEPYELLATLSIIPDEDGVCQFSIHEILKKNIAIKNNLLLGTLPNNLDAWTGFFIKYCEVYDDSDGTTLSTLAESYTSDLANFEGYAVNAILPFKNVYSGALSEYISADSSQKFLTAFAQPTIFSGQYFDLSFIFPLASAPVIKQEHYLNDVLQETTYVELTASDEGVYRAQVTDPDCDYNQVKATGLVSRLDDDSLAAYANQGAGTVSWTAAHPSVVSSGTFNNTTITSKDRVKAHQIINGRQYSVSFEYAGSLVAVASPGDSGGADIELTITLGLYDSSFALLQSVELFNETDFSSGPTGPSISVSQTTGTTSFTAGQDAAYIGIRAVFQEIDSTGSYTTQGSVSMYGLEITGDTFTETKTIDIDCKCVKSKATGYYLSWLNYLGGFDYWYFTEYADHIIDITESGETEENLFPDWPNSYGEFSDTIRKQTFKRSRRQIVVRSQNLTLAQLQAIEYIKTSPLVQIVNSIYDRRTVMVDSDSFTSYREGQKEQYTISFTITYTDDVPSQTV